MRSVIVCCSFVIFCLALEWFFCFDWSMIGPWPNVLLLSALFLHFLAFWLACLFVLILCVGVHADVMHRQILKSVFFFAFVQACKEALREVGPLLGSAAVNQMFQKHLMSEGSLHYGEFMNDLSRLLVRENAPVVLDYVASVWNFYVFSNMDRLYSWCMFCLSPPVAFCPTTVHNMLMVCLSIFRLKHTWNKL